ncbi:MAG: nucleoside deaminase [Actinobacteria bacterium]|nr:nucleoside deaminase [Actinomycetota bacterium]
MNLEEAMSLALDLAQKSTLISNDVPVGAVILNSAGEVVATGTNERELHKDPTAHAEIVALRKAALNSNKWRLDTHTLVVTLEPCAMCAGAIGQSRINRLVFGAWDVKAGAVGSVWDVLRDPRALHKVEVVTGVLAKQSAELLQDFFKAQRQRN